ncbi:MAG: hypothetical protein RugAbin2_02176 [Rugosibacter sp.]|jgi:hypothetical protein|nr:hypothetical protein [Rugosibacter sp.]
MPAAAGAVESELISVSLGLFLKPRRFFKACRSPVLLLMAKLHG